MKRFVEADITSEKLTHMVHTEDLIFYGDRAADLMVNALNDVFKTLGGEPSSVFAAKKKIDGAPSVIAASNFHGDRFVATKGFFANDRKIARSPEDVMKYFGHSEGLAKKMLKLLAKLDEINIPADEIWQGDFLFDHDSLFRDVFGGEDCIAFHPNTIIYAIPMTDPMARRVMRADIGVAWHTRYVGPDFNSLQISFDVSLKELQQTPSVYQIDSSIGDLSKSAAFPPKQFEELSLQLTDIKVAVHKLQNHNVLETISSDKNLQLYFLSFRNYLIKQFGRQRDDDYANKLLEWVKEKFDKDIEKKKQEKTKEAARAVRDAELDKIRAIGSGTLRDIGELQNAIVELKEALIDKLSDLSGWRTFLHHVDRGYIPTGEEGYAISDRDGNIQKFVSRLEFSKANFSKEIVKGWMSDKRINEASKSDVEAATDDLLSKHGLHRRKRLSKTKNTKDVYSTEVEAPAGVPRGVAAKQFVTKENDVVVDQSIPSDGKRPVVTIEVVGAQIKLNFKDNSRTSRKMSAKLTAEMESTWAMFMRAANQAEDPPSYDEAFASFSGLTEDWYACFVEGSAAINDYLLDRDYVFSRGAETYPHKAISIHQLITSTFTTRKDLFKHIGRSKDAWNPSDVYACVESDYMDICDAWLALEADKSLTLDSLNGFLLTELQSKRLVGISLKKIGGDVSLEAANTEKVEPPRTHYDLTALELDLRLKSFGASKDGVTFTLSTDNEVISGQIRYFGESDYKSRLGGAIQMELKKVGAKAQLGKVPKGITNSWGERLGVVFLNKREAIQSAQELFSIDASKRELVGSIPAMVAELEQGPVASNVTTKGLRELLRQLSLTTWEDLTDEDRVHLGWVALNLQHALLFSRAAKNHLLEEFLNSIVNGAKKIGVDNAPFVKVS